MLLRGKTSLLLLYRKDHDEIKLLLHLIASGPFFVRMLVGKRSDAVKVQSKGLFPGAKVSRGRDWADQDGGNGEIGTLTEITAWSGVERSGAKVMWNTLGNKTHRVGYQGSVRLHVIIKINNTISRFLCIYVSNSFPFLSWELGLKIDLAFVVWLHSSAGIISVMWRKRG